MVFVQTAEGFDNPESQQRVFGAEVLGEQMCRAFRGDPAEDPGNFTAELRVGTSVGQKIAKRARDALTIGQQSCTGSLSRLTGSQHVENRKQQIVIAALARRNGR